MRPAYCPPGCVIGERYGACSEHSPSAVEFSTVPTFTVLKEQLDRIERLLRDEFRDRLVRAFQQLELTYLSNREDFRTDVLGDAEGDYQEAGEIWADWIIGVMDEDQNA